MFDSLTDVPLLGGAKTAPDGRTFIVGGHGGERILVPLVDPTVPVLTDQLGVAATVAKATGASLQLTTPVSEPERPPKAYREAITAEAERQLLDWAVDEASTLTSGVPGSLLHSRRFVTGIHHLIDTHDIDIMVLPSTSHEGLLGRAITDRLVANARCDVIVVNGRPGYDDVASILLPIAGGPHSGLAADTARHVAEPSDAWIDILHVIEEDAPDRRRDQAEAYVEAAYDRIARPSTTTTWILEAEDIAEAIVEQSRYYGLTVIGAPTVGRLHRFVYGSTNRSIRAEAKSVVLSARNYGAAETLVNE